jgi:ABC-type uncharacterized transport system permease subunit
MLPFRWMVAFPVELLRSRLTLAAALTGLAVQAGWFVLSLLLLRAVWRGGADMLGGWRMKCRGIRRGQAAPE